MSKLLEDIQKIQSETGCSLAEAKEAYDKASCDIDLAIALINEQKGLNQKQSFNEPKVEEKKVEVERPVETTNTTQQQSYSNYNSNINNSIERNQKSLKKVSLTFDVIGTIALAAIVLLINLKKLAWTIYWPLLIIPTCFILLALVLKRASKSQDYVKMNELKEKYPDKSEQELTNAVLKNKGDYQKADESLSSGTSYNTQTVNNRNSKRTSKAGSAIVTLVLFLGIAIFAVIYFKPFKTLPVWSAYSEAKASIKTECKQWDAKYKIHGCKYVYFYDEESKDKHGAGYDIYLCVSFTHNAYGGDTTTCEYFGYNVKTKELKEASSSARYFFEDTDWQPKGSEGKVGTIGTFKQPSD